VNATSTWVIAGLGALLASGQGGPAWGATEVISFENRGFQTPVPYAPFTHVIPLPQFDGSKGTLISVTYATDFFYATLTPDIHLGMPNLLPSSNPFDPPPGVDYKFTFTDYFGDDPLRLATSGEIDFVHGGDNPAFFAIDSVFSNPADLGVFVGTGTVDFNGLSSVVTNDKNAAPDLALQINAMGSITYTYIAVPEPASGLLVGMAGFLLAALKLPTGLRRAGAVRR
jgi:hypothetical protein